MCLLRNWKRMFNNENSTCTSHTNLIRTNESALKHNQKRDDMITHKDIATDKQTWKKKGQKRKEKWRQHYREEMKKCQRSCIHYLCMHFDYRYPYY